MHGYFIYIEDIYIYIYLISIASNYVHGLAFQNYFSMYFFHFLGTSLIIIIISVYLSENHCSTGFEDFGFAFFFCLCWVITVFSLVVVSSGYCSVHGSDSKESACNAGDSGSSPRWGKSPREGNGYPLHYSCMENCMERGTYRATVHGISKSWTQLSD